MCVQRERKMLTKNWLVVTKSPLTRVVGADAVVLAAAVDATGDTRGGLATVLLFFSGLEEALWPRSPVPRFRVDAEGAALDICV
jgi:hypothetical protein